MKDFKQDADTSGYLKLFDLLIHKNKLTKFMLEEEVKQEIKLAEQVSVAEMETTGKMTEGSTNKFPGV